MGRKVKDYTGETVGGFVGVNSTGEKRETAFLWVFRCLACGRKVEKLPGKVRYLKSCGCRANIGRSESMRLRPENIAAAVLRAKRRQKAVGMRERGWTLRQIGVILGVSKERVRQLLLS